MEGFKDQIEDSVIDLTANRLGKRLEGKSLQEVCEQVIESCGVIPEVAISEPDWAKLESEAGLVISNHPGYYDAFIILSLIKRKDVKVVVSKDNYAKIGKIIDENLLIEAGKDYTSVRKMLKEIDMHIKSGGIVLLFPTGGTDRVDSDQPELVIQSGLKTIIRRNLAETDMIFSFFVKPEDIKPLADENIPRPHTHASAVATNLPNLNKLKPNAHIHITGKYSNARNWSDQINEKPLEDIFTGQFN